MAADAKQSAAQQMRLTDYCTVVRKWLSEDAQLETRKLAQEKRCRDLNDCAREYESAAKNQTASFNTGQKKQIVWLAYEVLLGETQLQIVDHFVTHLREAPTVVQLMHVRADLRRHFDLLRVGAHHDLLVLLGIDSPGAHGESTEVSSWLTQVKMTDQESKEVIEMVLTALAADVNARHSVKRGMLLTADCANASLLYRHIDGCTYLGDVFTQAHTELRRFISETLTNAGFTNLVPARLPLLRDALYARASQTYARALKLAGELPRLADALPAGLPTPAPSHTPTTAQDLRTDVCRRPTAGL
jgi:hypothetical protein